VLPVEGAPLVFSTGYAHDIVLTLSGKDGGTIELPAKADALQGGFVVDTSTLVTASLGDVVRCTATRALIIMPAPSSNRLARVPKRGKWLPKTPEL